MMKNKTLDRETLAPISSHDFYSNYHGHTRSHLEQVCAQLRNRHDSLVFLAGDSSLDSKYWFEDQAPAVNGFEDVLRPPIMKTDVAYFMNLEASQTNNNNNNQSVGTINAAVEATTLSDRQASPSGLLPQDEFIRDNIRANDVLVVSIGGNDIALKPLARTVVNTLSLVYLTPLSALEGGRGDHASVCASAGAWLSGLAYFENLFKNQVEDYINKLVSASRPRMVIVCMIYFPLEDAGYPSWAGPSLRFLRYDTQPKRLQSLIRAVFARATSRIRLPGVASVEAFPMYEVMDGKNPEDYVERVEPSPLGSRKIARELMRRIVAATKEDDDDDENR